MPISLEGLNAFSAKDSNIICDEVLRAFGTREGNVTCEVGWTPDGAGICIRFLGTPHGGGQILTTREVWRNAGVIEQMVRKSLDVAYLPAGVESLLLKK